MTVTPEFLDMLLDLGFMPLITKATRITDHTSTLIDHIYTNTRHKILNAGICLADISDHLPIVCTVANKLPVTNDVRPYRDYLSFDNNAFLKDIEQTHFISLIDAADVNEGMNRRMKTLEIISNKHAPIRKLSTKKKKQVNKPWLSNAIIISIK